jgi:hypothetical protein
VQSLVHLTFNNGRLFMVIKLCLLFVLVSCAGCAVPLLLGVKDYDRNGDHTHINFITGVSGEANVSGTDTLKNDHAIHPTK